MSEKFNIEKIDLEETMQMKVINLLILLISSYLFYLGMINIEKIAISIPLTTITTLPIAISLDKLFTKRKKI